jgi:aminoglycoside phosphotransferase (APT) family kinase protein
MSIRETSGFVEDDEFDSALSVELVQSVVYEQFPHLADRPVELLESGWSYDAYLVDRTLVFRFPRHAVVADDLPRRERLLALVGSAVGAHVGIPRSVLRGTPSARFPYAFVAHEYIAGEQAWKAAVTPELAGDIGRALARIHAIQPSAAAAIDVPTLRENLRDLLNQTWQGVSQVPAVKSSVPGPYRWLAAGPAVPNDYDGPPRFIHSDLIPRHIIVNRATGRLSGILDWEPVFGDPAFDFSYLPYSGPLSFVRQAVNGYELSGDHALMERTIFLGRIRSLGWMAHAIEDNWYSLAERRFVDKAFGLSE